jgi:hypothetical protein
MKVSCAFSVVGLAALVAVSSQQAIAGGHSGIPLPVGQFSTTTQGSLAICLNPTSFATEACSTSGVLVFPLSVLSNGSLTSDKTGNSCSTETEVDSALPVGSSPPTVTTNEHSVNQLLTYNSSTGIGDWSFTLYVGGSCNGAAFDSTGASEIANGTLHFVVTDRKRTDIMITTLTNPSASVGAFSLSATDLSQAGSKS